MDGYQARMCVCVFVERTGYEKLYLPYQILHVTITIDLVVQLNSTAYKYSSQ